MGVSLDPQIIELGREMFRQGASVTELARHLGIHRGTLYPHLTDADKKFREEVFTARNPIVDPEPVRVDPKPSKSRKVPPGKHERKSKKSDPRDRFLFDPVPQSYHPYVIDTPGLWGTIMDSHFPYHDRATIELFAAECKKRKVVGILLNGDILDSHEVSDHDKDPRAPRYVEEIELGKMFFSWLRYKFPKTRIVYKQGNHEERLDRYIIRRAPALFGLEGVNIQSLLHLDDYGVELVSDKRVIQLGKLNIIHGHEYPGGVSSPVNPARGLYLKARSLALAGHHHRSSYHQERNIRQKPEAAWSVGCSCFLHPAYRPLNNWNLGFAFIDVANDGEFVVYNHTVEGGKMM